MWQLFRRFFKEYKKYVGTVDSDIHDEQAEVDHYWKNIKKRSLNVGDNMDIQQAIYNLNVHLSTFQ